MESITQKGAHDFENNPYVNSSGGLVARRSTEGAAEAFGFRIFLLWGCRLQLGDFQGL